MAGRLPRTGTEADEVAAYHDKFAPANLAPSERLPPLLEFHFGKVQRCPHNPILIPSSGRPCGYTLLSLQTWSRVFSAFSYILLATASHGCSHISVPFSAQFQSSPHRKRPPTFNTLRAQIEMALQLRGLTSLHQSRERSAHLMLGFGIHWDHNMLEIDQFSFGGLGLTLDQLRMLRAEGYSVPELDRDGNWVSQLVETIVATARYYRICQESAVMDAVLTDHSSDA